MALQFDDLIPKRDKKSTIPKTIGMDFSDLMPNRTPGTTKTTTNLSTPQEEQQWSQTPAAKLQQSMLAQQRPQRKFIPESPYNVGGYTAKGGTETYSPIGEKYLKPAVEMGVSVLRKTGQAIEFPFIGWGGITNLIAGEGLKKAGEDIKNRRVTGDVINSILARKLEQSGGDYNQATPWITASASMIPDIMEMWAVNKIYRGLSSLAKYKLLKTSVSTAVDKMGKAGYVDDVAKVKADVLDKVDDALKTYTQQTTIPKEVKRLGKVLTAKVPPKPFGLLEQPITEGITPKLLTAPSGIKALPSIIPPVPTATQMPVLGQKVTTDKALSLPNGLDGISGRKVGYGAKDLMKTKGEASQKIRNIANMEAEIVLKDKAIFEKNKNLTIEQLQNKNQKLKSFADEKQISYPREIRVNEEIIRQKTSTPKPIVNVPKATLGQPQSQDIKVGLDILKKEPTVSSLKGKKLESVKSITDRPMRIPLNEVEITYPVKDGDPAFWYKETRILLSPEQKSKVLSPSSPLSANNRGAIGKGESTLKDYVINKYQLSKGIASPIKTELTLGDLTLSKKSIVGALDDNQIGLGSKTNKPIEVHYDTKNNHFIVIDGQHRIANLIKNGEAVSSKKIPVVIRSTGYSDHATPFGDNIYKLPTSPSPLAAEARKYKSAEEFVKGITQNNRPIRNANIGELVTIQSPTYGRKSATEFNMSIPRTGTIVKINPSSVSVKIGEEIYKFPAEAKISSFDLNYFKGKDNNFVNDFYNQATSQGIKPSILKEERGAVNLDIPITPENMKSIETKWDNIREFVDDDWLRVKKLIQRKGTIITETNNPYEAEIRYWGRLGTRVEEADNIIVGIDKDIVSTSRTVKVPDTELSKEINQYLIARHAPERNAALGEKAAGITNKEAEKILADIASKPYAKEVERIANDIQNLNNKTLDVLLESGVIDKTLFDTLKTKYKHHIPLNRVMSENDDIVEVLTRKGFGVQGAGLKRAFGSEKEVADILTNVVTNYKSALVRSEKNIIDNHTLRFVRDNKYFDGLFEEVKPKAVGKTFEGKIILEKIIDPKVLPLREEGKQVYLKINDPQLAMALRGVNRQKVEGLIRGVKLVTRFYAGLATRFNPEFAFSNKIRDIQETLVYLASKKEVGVKGALKTAAKDPESIKDVTDYIRGKKTKGTALYHQMKMDGGTTGGMGLSTRKELEIDLGKIRNINRSNTRKAAQSVLKAVDDWNTIFEDSTRLSVYKQALAQGASRNRAAVLAKEASVNFNKMGTGMPVVNALYMFSNASVRGSVKMIKAMKNPKVAGIVLTLLGGSIYIVNEYNDKIDEDWREKVSKWDHLNSINVVIPTNDGIRYFSIPISWGLKPIKVMLDTAYNVAFDKKTDIGEAVGNIATSVIEGYNPIGGTDAISAITPTILDLPVDLARNRAWHGGRIKPDWNPSDPESIKYFDKLKQKAMGRAAIYTTKELGEKGIEISPADINYSYEQLIGGTGRATNKVFNTIVGMTKGEVETKEIPFASRFYRDIPEEKIFSESADFKTIKKLLEKQSKERFYLNQEAEVLYESMKTLPPDKANYNHKKMKTTNPQLYDKIKDIASSEKRDLDYNDRLVLQLGVENGQRARFIFEKTKTMPDRKAKNEYIRELRKKKIVTDEVIRQLKFINKSSPR